MQYRPLSVYEVRAQLPHRTGFYQGWLRRGESSTNIPFFKDTLSRALLGRYAVRLNQDVVNVIKTSGASAILVADEKRGFYHNGNVEAFDHLDISAELPRGVYTWIRATNARGVK